MTDWHPIDTAPNNMNDVLVSNGAYVKLGYRGDDVWKDSTIDYRGELEPQPTHWMPLPSPPVPEQ